MIAVLKHMNGGSNFWRWIHKEQEACDNSKCLCITTMLMWKGQDLLAFFFHLFLLAVEPLPMKICQEDKMPGVKLAIQWHKLELHVDEVMPTVSQSEDSLALLMDICNNKIELCVRFSN